MKLAAVIFDWAGTMVDFGSLAPVIAMRMAFEAEGVAVEDTEIRDGMGLAKSDHVRAMLATPRIAQAWTAARGQAPAEDDAARIFSALGPLMRDAGAQRTTLIPGALAAYLALRSAGVSVGSTTGYTREMMEPILGGAAAQGYAPDVVVCAGETKTGRPSPLMIWKALVEMGAYPASAVVKVDDAPVGIAEGVSAGCFTVGVAASGNALGLDLDAFRALPDAERADRLRAAGQSLAEAGADAVIPTVAELPELLRERGWL